MNSDERIDMEYNTSRDELQIPEYGRNIQKMIEHAKTLESRDERNKAARSIIRVMGQVNPYLKANEDLTHKLWDHMFIISGFDFDVDSPFPKPLREDFETGPDRIPYPDSEIRYRHYGRILEQMIAKVAAAEDEDQRKKMGAAVANVMKRAYLNWNRDSVEDRVILKDLKDLSRGRIDLVGDVELAQSKELIDANPRQNPQGGGGGGKRKNRNKRKKNNNNNNNNNHRRNQQRN